MITSMKMQMVAGALFLIALAGVFFVACVRLYRMVGPQIAAMGASSAYSDHNTRGNTAYGHRDYETAIQEYGAMVEEKPDKMDGYFLRAMAEDKARLYGASIRDNTTVLTLLKTPDPYYHGSPGLARGRFSTRPAPRSIHNDAAADAYFNRGMAYQGQGHLSLAIADFSANLSRLPGDYDGLEARMPAYYDNKQYALALADSNALLSTHPRDQWAHCFRGKAEMSLGSYAAAFRDLSAAIDIAPDYRTPYFVLSLMTHQTHQYLPTLAIEQKGILENPDDIELKGNIGWLQYEAGQLPAAIVTDKQVLAQNPSMTWVRYNLGLCYAVLGDAADARQTYTQALTANDQASRSGSKKDIADALVRLPGSPVLQQCLQQLAENERPRL